MVRAARDGRTARGILLREHPEIVLLDLGLPDIRGLDLFDVFRAEAPETAVIVVTTSIDLETAVEAMRRGAENFLAKPFRMEHLEAVVERAYEHVALRRQNRELIERQAQALPGRDGAIEVLSPAIRRLGLDE